MRINTLWSVRIENYLPAKLTWLSCWEKMLAVKSKDAIVVQNRFIVLKDKVKGLVVFIDSFCEKSIHNGIYNTWRSFQRLCFIVLQSNLSFH